MPATLQARSPCRSLLPAHFTSIAWHCHRSEMSDELDEIDDDPLQTRIDRMVLRVLKLHSSLPRRADSKVVAARMLKSATFTAIGYRAATRARTNEQAAEHLHRSLDRIDELRHWLKFLVDGEIIVPARRLDDLRTEVSSIHDVLQERLTSVQPEDDE